MGKSTRSSMSLSRLGLRTGQAPRNCPYHSGHCVGAGGGLSGPYLGGPGSSCCVGRGCYICAGEGCQEDAEASRHSCRCSCQTLCTPSRHHEPCLLRLVLLFGLWLVPVRVCVFGLVSDSHLWSLTGVRDDAGCRHFELCRQGGPPFCNRQIFVPDTNLTWTPFL